MSHERDEETGMTKHKFKKDRFSRSRGGTSEFLNIHCSSCNTHVALYQKDGPGSLMRMYLDRIFEPGDLASLQNHNDKKSVPSLNCPSCHTLIAVPIVYKPENRLALRMIQGAFYKNKSDGTYPQK